MPPEFAGNVRSVKANYGCGLLLGVTNDEQLRVCDPMPGLPAEWTGKIRRVDGDCSTSTSDRIILELWTGDNFEGGILGLYVRMLIHHRRPVGASRLFGERAGGARDAEA